MKFKYKNKTLELIYLTFSGSRLYNTHYELGQKPLDKDYVSDYDWKGIFIESIEDKISLLDKKLEQIEIKTDTKKEEEEFNLPIKLFLQKILNDKYYPFDIKNDDITLYEVDKFIDLSIVNNPNILDLLFVPNKHIIYINDKGKALINSRHLFLSKMIKQTFFGYAESQLSRIKSHKSHFNKYPEIYMIQNMLQKAYDNSDISRRWIENYFSIYVAIDVVKKNVGTLLEEENTTTKELTFEEFVNLYNIENLPLEIIKKYKRPIILDYVSPKFLNGEKFNLNTKIIDLANNKKANLKNDTVNNIIQNKDNIENMTINDFLMEEATFRNISKTQFNIFTPLEWGKKQNGILSREGNLKQNPPINIGDFLFQITIDEMNYKKDIDAYDELWNWKVHRNEKRSTLEEQYGYDTKHAMHLFRLLIKSLEILQTQDYNPELKGEILIKAKQILEGHLSYDELMSLINSLKEQIIIAYEKSHLKAQPNLTNINALKMHLLLNKPYYFEENNTNVKQKIKQRNI